MNLFDATEISIEGKDVQKIEINDRVVWEKNTEPYLKSLILSTSSQRIDAWKQLAVTALAKDQHNDGFPDALVTVNCISTFAIEDILEIDENLTVETNNDAFLISNDSSTVLPISIPSNSNMEMFIIQTFLNSGTLYKQYTLNGTTVTLGTSTDLNAAYWSFEDGVYYFGDDGDSVPDGITSFDLGLAPGTDVSISRNFLRSSVVYQESFSGTTDNRGYLDINYMPKQRGQYTFQAVAENITSNSVSVIVTTPVELGDISLVSDKDIISSYDHESALLTATVLDTNDDPVEGELVTFEVVGGEVLGSEVTDASGECSVYYVGKGTGDLNIRANVRMFFSETYSIEDCNKYDDCSTDKSSMFSTIGNASVSYANTEYELSATSNDRNAGVLAVDFHSLTDYEAEITFRSSSSGGACGVWISNNSNSLSNSVGIEPSGSNISLKKFVNGSYTIISALASYTRVSYAKIVITKNGTSYNFKLYSADNNLLGERTETFTHISTPYLHIWEGNTGTHKAYFKNIKIKQL